MSKSLYHVCILYFSLVGIFFNVEPTMRRYLVYKAKPYYTHYYGIRYKKILEAPFKINLASPNKLKSYEIFLEDHIVKFPTKEYLKKVFNELNLENFVQITGIIDIIDCSLISIDVVKELDARFAKYYQYLNKNKMSDDIMNDIKYQFELKKEKILAALLVNDPVAKEQLRLLGEFRF